MSIEIERNKKSEKINQLLEQKQVSVIDDYNQDVFVCDVTNEVIFKAIGSRAFERSPELIDSTMDEIISKLESHNIKKHEDGKE